MDKDRRGQANEGGTFNMSFQIVNVETLNAVHNTCVFSCFAAGDSVSNFQAVLDSYINIILEL